MINLDKTLYGASLFALAFTLNAADVNAQTCTTAPSCETLGFTKSSADCEGHSILKCPFDQSKLYCDSGATSGNSGGETDCNVGAILYSDKTCSAELISGKTAIGVVFDADRRLAMALEQKEKMVWSEDIFDIPDLPNLTSQEAALADFNGKNNTKIASTYCKKNNKSCPAIEYVSSYKTVGTNTGDWYLPALGELNEMFKNRYAIRTTLDTISAAEFFSNTYKRYWSSSESYGSYTWDMAMQDDKYLSCGTGSKDGYMYKHVRPVLAF